jgi:hypothetical protein
VNDLTTKEQHAVRTALRFLRLRFLRLRVGAWGPLAKALRYEWDSLQKVATGKRTVTPALALALRVARVAGIGMDAWTRCLRGSGEGRGDRHGRMDALLAGQWLSSRVCGMDALLAGQWLSSRVCPHCGHPPDDFVDEETDGHRVGSR